MEKMMWLSLFIWGYISCGVSALGFFDDVLSDTYSCNGVCDRTYPLHTYDKSSDLQFCMRGCRLFSLIDFINNDENLNHTRTACHYSCKEAYDNAEDEAACKLGCDSQVEQSEMRRGKIQQMSNDEDPFLPLYPFLYVHNWYSNMFDKMVDHATVTWSFYIQSQDGRLVVTKSEPSVVVSQQQHFIAFPLQIDSDDEYKTSNYMETNLALIDNSATPNFKHSQVQFAVESDDQVKGMAFRHDESQDWLSCISKKTGFPRLLLSLTLLLSAVVMIWLCFTTAATAPEQKAKRDEKLSIYGDIEILKEFDLQYDLAPIHIQEKKGIEINTQAPELPIKVKVESI